MAPLPPSVPVAPTVTLETKAEPFSVNTEPTPPRVTLVALVRMPPVDTVKQLPVAPATPMLSV